MAPEPPLVAEKKVELDRQGRTARTIYQRLLEYYGTPAWGDPSPPLDELISTILSQNTNDTNRDRAFNMLRGKFPTWEAVRDADPEEVIDAIRSAGLANQKGPRIQAVLRNILSTRQPQPRVFTPMDSRTSP
jgi:endonuclease-3